MDIQNKISELMANEAFVAEFSSATTPQDVVDLFGKNGVEVPVALAEELFDPTLYAEGELPEDMLDDVSGGGKWGKCIGKALGKAAYYGAGYLGAKLAGYSKEESKKYAKKCGVVGGFLGGQLGNLIV